MFMAVKTKENYADNLANIAHQLKTKITTLSLALQLSKKSDSAMYVQQMESQLESLTWLEEALLTLSKIDAGVLQLECSKVDIYTALTLARSIFEMQNGNITARNMRSGGACFEIRVYSH